MFEVSVVVFAAEAGGDLAQGGDILAGLAAGDEGSLDRVADSDDEGAADGRGHFGHAGGGDGVAVADDQEGGGAGEPGPRDLRAHLETVEEAGLAGGEDLVHGKVVENVEKHFAVAAFPDDRFRAIVGGDDGDVDFFVGDPFEERLDEGGGPLGAAERLVETGVAETHGRGDVEDKKDMLALGGFDFPELGAVGFRGEEPEDGEGPGEEGEGEDADQRREGAEEGRAKSGAEGEARDAFDPGVVEQLRAGGEDERGETDEDWDGHHGV